MTRCSIMSGIASTHFTRRSIFCFFLVSGIVAAAATVLAFLDVFDQFIYLIIIVVVTVITSLVAMYGVLHHLRFTPRNGHSFNLQRKLSPEEINMANRAASRTSNMSLSSNCTTNTTATPITPASQPVNPHSPPQCGST